MLRNQSAVKSQDVVVACRLFSTECSGQPEWTYASLSDDLGMSTSSVHESVERCRLAGVLSAGSDRGTTCRRELADLLADAVPKIFFAIRTGVVVGVPTGSDAPPLAGKFKSLSGAVVRVWPDAGGAVRGEGVLPLHPGVPELARRDPLFYEILALVDVMRLGSGADRRLASEMVEQRVVRQAGRRS